MFMPVAFTMYIMAFHAALESWPCTDRPGVRQLPKQAVEADVKFACDHEKMSGRSEPVP